MTTRTARRPPTAKKTVASTRASATFPPMAVDAPGDGQLELQIGTRLKHARLMRGVRLKDVAETAGCSESLISKIENDKVQASLHTLHKICAALGLTLGELFEAQAEDDPVVTRAGRRSLIEFDPLRRGKGLRMERVIPYAAGRLLQSNIHIIAPGGATEGLISHRGEEVGYVITGEIELTVGDKIYRLRPGDTFCFRSETKHGYRNIGRAEARLFWVNTPPTF